MATRRKRFMLDFALKNSFDPLVGSNWHRFCPSDISVEKVSFWLRVSCLFSCFYIFIILILILISQNGRSVMKYYNGNLHEAISDLFPLPRQNLVQGYLSQMYYSLLTPTSFFIFCFYRRS